MQSSFIRKASATTFTIAKCTTALIILLCMQSALTPLSRSFLTTKLLTNDNVDRTVPCFSTAHIFMASIDVFSAISATQNFYPFPDSMRAGPIIIFTFGNLTKLSPSFFSTYGSSVFWNLMHITLFLPHHLSEWYFPLADSAWYGFQVCASKAAEECMPSLGIVACTDGRGSSCADPCTLCESASPQSDLSSLHAFYMPSILPQIPDGFIISVLSWEIKWSTVRFKLSCVLQLDRRNQKGSKSCQTDYG